MNIKLKLTLYESEVKQAIAEAVIDPLRKCAMAVEAEAKRSMKKGGRIRGVRGRVLRHGVPSAPGEPPHVQTGTLRASIQHAPFKTLMGTETYIVGPGRVAWYGRIHEYGYQFGGRKWPARPFMRPALATAQQKFPNLFRALKLAQTRAGRKTKGMNP
jgi:HK97 gp10 family phage protein